MTIKAVLFDLDGTLLSDDIRSSFVPAYFGKLMQYLAPWVDPERLRQGLWAGTAAMAANDGSSTNEEAFAAVFYPYVGVAQEVLAPEIAVFYAREFPALRTYARPRPEARRVVEAAFSLGYAVAISTNPHFPATATYQRLEWAGVQGFAYSKVTTYENSHFAKPSLGYYREVLGDLGCSAPEALVVGDEAMDMVAGNLGCLTYLVTSSATQRETIVPPPTFEGTLAEVENVLLQLRQ